VLADTGELQANAIAAAGSFSSLIVDELNEEVKQVCCEQHLPVNSRCLLGYCTKLRPAASVD
jgi:hypothetical protein